MKTLHRALMTGMLTAVLALAVGAMHPGSLVAEAQHGHGQHGTADDPQAHFDELAKHLELTADQREAITAPFTQAFAAMQELHRLHGVIAAELTPDQQQKLAKMMHEAMGNSMSAERHHGAEQH